MSRSLRFIGRLAACRVPSLATMIFGCERSTQAYMSACRTPHDGVSSDTMKAKVIRIDGSEADTGPLQEAARVLEAGGLVALPTETVYGIACRVSREALSRLNGVKGRDTEKHYTLHIGQGDEYRKYVPKAGLRTEKLIRKAWPGPLTLVFQLDPIDLSRQKSRLDAEVAETLYKNGSIGIRCPDHAAASMLLQLAQGPVVAPSANLAGQAPATDASQVVAALGDQIDLVLDAGPCKYKKSSTVAKVDTQGVTLLREGVYSEADLQAMAGLTFLFVCTGNTCRSAMAEGLLRAHLAKKVGCPVDGLEAMGYKVASVGTMDMAGMPASNGAMAACRSKGVDIRNHASQHLTPSIVETSDLIFCMTRSHCQHVCDLSSDAQDRCFLLAKDMEIPDPVGRPQEYFDRCADMIETAIKARLSEFML